MSPQIWLLTSLLSLAGQIGPAEAGDQGGSRFYGIPSGDEVRACGIEIDDGAVTRLSAFVDATAELRGHYRLSVTRWAGGNVAEMRQENRIEAGRLDESALLIDHPDRLRVTLQVWTEQGAEVCIFERELSLSDGTTDI